MMKNVIITALLLCLVGSVSAESGLVVYYPFDGNALDSSGNGNDGTVNGATYVSGVSGPALSFDGTDDYVDAGNDRSLSWLTPQSAYTIEYWVKTTAGQSQLALHTVGSKIDGSGLIYPGGQLNRPAVDKIQVWLKDTANLDIIVYSTNTIGWNDGNWHHIVISKTSGSAASTVSIFVDGSEIGLTISVDENPSAQSYDEKTIIGGVDDAGSVSGNFNGAIDEVRIYNRALSATEIQANYDTRETFTNSIGIDFVLIPSGEFDRGSPSSESGRDSDEGPVHRVKISKPFYLGKYEVTQKQWREVMGSNPSYFSGCDNCPVEKVSWNDAQEFIRKLNQKEGTDKYRLPTEAEWEYAARAGTKTRYSFGDDESRLGEYAWYDENSGSKTHPVGQKKSNPWGLYDVHGNVDEWVQDWYGDYPSGTVTDPQGPSSGSYRVLRGGSWGTDAKNCRSAHRYYHSPDRRSYGLGFRLAFQSLPQANYDAIVNPTTTTSTTTTTVPTTPSPSVYLYGEKTDVEVGEDISLSFSAVNLIRNQEMTVQLILKVPSGMSVTSTGFTDSGAGQYTRSVPIGPGEQKYISININTNQAGNFEIIGEMYYYLGNESTPEYKTEKLPVVVRNTVPTTTTTTAPAVTQKPETLGEDGKKRDNGGICGPTALLGIAILPLGLWRLLRRRR